MSTATDDQRQLAQDAVAEGFPISLARLILDQGIDFGPVSNAYFQGMDPEEIAKKLGLNWDDGSAQPQQQQAQYAQRARKPPRLGPQSDMHSTKPRQAQQQRMSRPAQQQRQAPIYRASRGNVIYRWLRRALGVTFGFLVAYLFWRIDGFFGIAGWNLLLANLQRPPLPNTLFWPPVWTWVVGLLVSAGQAYFWPHRELVDQRGTILQDASTPPEIAVWVMLMAYNLGTSAIGLRPILPGVDLILVAVPPETAAGTISLGTWFVIVVFAGLFAIFPEWIAQALFPQLYELLLPGGLRYRVARMLQWYTNLQRTHPYAAQIIGYITAAIVGVLLVIFVAIMLWSVFAPVS